MTELWWMFRGYVRLRLTSADPEGAIGILSREVRMSEIERTGPLEILFSAAQSDLSKVEATIKSMGGGLEVLNQRGFPSLIGVCGRNPVIMLTAILLVAASLWLPSRVLFFRVEGNRNVPDRLILETAAECGLSFGAARRELRSEQIKNRLLEAMPQLSWVGVNTQGSVATISVRERGWEPEVSEPLPGNIVASVDGLITEVTVTRGTPNCKVGDGVRAGQVLISGYTDLGLCTHVEPAEGEIYALTYRQRSGVIPRETLVPATEQETVRKFSLLLGKNRINFYSDSGILYTGCGKMTQIRALRLPGGWELPVAWIVETYSVRERHPESRAEDHARLLLEKQTQTQIDQEMIAGEILRSESEFDGADGAYRLMMLCECREMIGRRTSGILTEGDTNDG